MRYHGGFASFVGAGEVASLRRRECEARMIVLHAIWTDGALHLWGERALLEPGDSTGESARAGGPPSAPAGAAAECAPGQPPPVPSVFALAVGHTALRRSVGDVYDSLLVSGADASELALRLPHRGELPVPSPVRGSDGVPADPARPPPRDASDGLSLRTCRVPTLVFSPPDAMDLLTACPRFVQENVAGGASLTYWSGVAGLTLELLAGQRFVPAIHHAGGDRYRGYWRVVVNDEETSERLGALIASMPPVCRSLAVTGEPVQASDLFENFLWTTVDALVRRCLEGDELAHALHDRRDETSSPQMQWLRSLVRGDAELAGTLEERRRVYDTVITWLARLEPLVGGRSCRTCFRLHPPPAEDGAGTTNVERSWKLTVHVQATQAPDLVLDADWVLGERGTGPAILKRPFENARQQLHADIAVATQHFPPLARCLEPGAAMECLLTLEEAYGFLRDAMPILESEGFKVWVPNWWREDRPRLRMWLDLDPVDSPTADRGAAMGLDAIVSYDWHVAVGGQELSLDEMTQLAEEHQPLVKLRGRWTEIQASDVRAAIRFLRTSRRGRMTLLDALRQCYLADDLGTGLSVAGMRAHGWIEQFLNASGTNDAMERVSPPSGFHGELRPYQLRGLEWLSFLAKLGLGACLADDMGLGKTIQLIALWLHERESHPSPGPTLLVVPMSLVGNWQREIERFAPSLRVMVHHGMERLTGQEFVDAVTECDVVISTYGLIHRDLEHVAAVEWHRVALDEAQNIKNPAAKQAVAIRSLRAAHRAALTGTPVENRLSELWSIMDFLNAGYLGAATEFRRRFAVPIERYRDADRAQRLRHLLRPFVLRRLKSDPKVEADLPEKMEMKVFCNLTREQAALYEALVGDMLGQIDGAGGIQRRGLILATLVKLKQICNHPAHFLRDGSSLPHRSGKCDRLTEMLEEVLAEGDRALVFTQFREMGKLLLPLLHDTFDREVLFLHGGTTRQNRDKIVDRFQDPEGDVPMLILSLKAGGYGLNLTAANHVFHFDRWWNPAVEDQATDRVHRIGQYRRVQVHKFVCVGTLEERIDALLEQKRNLADHIVGSGEDWLTEMSTERLREMLTLSRDAVAED